MLAALYNQEWRAMMGGKIFRHYIPGLADNSLTIYSWRDALQIMRDDINTHDVQVFCAYNLPFDLGAMQKTHNMIASKRLDFSRLDLLCLWEFSCITVLRSQLYHDFAWQHGEAPGYITQANKLRTTAEQTYACLTVNVVLLESHK